MNQFIYYIKKLMNGIAYNRILPKGIRRPFMIVSSIIGLLFFNRIMLHLTHSLYLKNINDVLYIAVSKNIMMTTGFVVVLLLFCAMSKKYHQQISLGITVGYIVILALGIMGAIK